MCYKELWQKQKAEKEKKWIDNHKGADVAWCSQELIPTLHGREGKLNVGVYIIYFPLGERHPHESWYRLMHTSAGSVYIITPLI